VRGFCFGDRFARAEPVRPHSDDGDKVEKNQILPVLFKTRKLKTSGYAFYRKLKTG
jgi:hypothetical protein